MRLFLALLLLSQVVYGQVYKWVDDKGKVHYSDTRPERENVLEEGVEVKNSQLQYMSQDEESLLETYDEKREEDNLEEQQQAQQAEQVQLKIAKELAGKSSVIEQLQCFEPSPSVTPSGISELEINPRELTDNQIEQLENIFHNMDGHWKGSGEGFLCRGTIEKSDRRIRDYQVEAEGKASFSTALRFVVDLDSKDKGTSSQETYLFFIEDELLRLGSPSRAGDIELVQLTDQGFNLYQKRWLRLRGGGVNLIENIIQVTVNKGGFSFLRLSFGNGYLDEALQMNLK